MREELRKLVESRAAEPPKPGKRRIKATLTIDIQSLKGSLNKKSPPNKSGQKKRKASLDIEYGRRGAGSLSNHSSNLYFDDENHASSGIYRSSSPDQDFEGSDSIVDNEDGFMNIDDDPPLPRDHLSEEPN